MVYYIDPLIGYPENDGLSETSPLDTHKGLSLCAGDVVLFRRGTEYRGGIHHKGLDGEPVTFGAYGNGDPPKFFGSINRSEPYLWKETERKNVWQLAIPLADEPCNVIFDFGDHCGTLSWTLDGLDMQGKWYSDVLGSRVEKKPFEKAEFYMYSTENPGKYYGDIEIALYGDRMLFSADKNTVFDGLCASCAGVHGFAARRPENIVIKECRVEFIGGCVWDKNRRIRFGNGVECWDGGKNVTVEENSFYNIYDSCFTTQGSENMTPHENIRCAENTMIKYGMAAFELRDKIGKNVVFELNACDGAGHGFALQGERPPRMSEIYPEPMGHHVFIWRGIPTEGGHVEVRRNVFRGRPTGEAVYIRADSADAARQVNIENNEII
ncbi:MAG: hypothetical protein J5832_05370 [Clostridia bacterium]|nr:hypothetical protein [Clostridia bacterium]